MTILSTLLFLAVPTACGYFLVSLICRKNPLPFFVTLPVGYGIGMGLLTHWAVILSFLSVPLCAASINIPMIILTFLFAGLHLKSGHNYRALSWPAVRFDGVNLIFVVFILYILAYIFWWGVNAPMAEWDTYSTLGLKSKTIYYSQSLKYLPFMPKFDYPIHLELVLAWLSSCLGSWDNTVIKIVYPMSCLAYVAIQYSFMRYLTSIRWALFSIVLLLSSGFLVYHSAISYRDITMMFYNCTAVLLILLWHRQKQSMYLILAALFSGFTSFIKLEGFGYLGIHNLLVIMLMCKAGFLDLNAKIKWTSIFGLISLGIYGIFTVYKKTYILPLIPPELISSENFDLSRLSFRLSSETLFRMKIVVRRYVTDFFLSGNWALVWSIFFISGINISRKKISMEIKGLFFVLFLFFTIYFFSYTFTQHFFWIAERNDVLSRSLLHIFPMITILIPLLNTAEDED